jgi:hypothetical protein
MHEFANRICVFALAAAALFVPALSAQTNIPATVTRTTGLVGLAEGQTAQLNALNPYDGGSSCTGVIAFIADDGIVLKSKSVTVASGTGMHLTLDSVADLALAAGARRDIRGTITIAAAAPTSTAGSPATTTTTPPVMAACRLIGTLEIYNTDNGHSQVTLATDHRQDTPQLTPASGI